jgi:DNA repair ATPase RecN
MNIKKVRKQLKKINTLFSAIEEEGRANAIETELFKSYVLSLYEQVIVKGEKNEVKPQSRVVVKKEKSNKKDPESIFTESVEELVAEKEPIEAIVEQEFKAVKNGAMATGSAESVIDLEEKEVEEVEDIAEPIMDDQYDVLFQSDNSNELSNRLSKLPITDLNKAFGLNEKIFNINELFNGDTTVYQQAIDQLNRLNSIEEAKDYLVKDIVNQYEWLEDHKIKKAAQFIRVIHRRYM